MMDVCRLVFFPLIFLIHLFWGLALSTPYVEVKEATKIIIAPPNHTHHTKTTQPPGVSLPRHAHLLRTFLAAFKLSRARTEGRITQVHPVFELFFDGLGRRRYGTCGFYHHLRRRRWLRDNNNHERHANLEWFCLLRRRRRRLSWGLLVLRAGTI
jgi:hypothetical protein